MGSRNPSRLSRPGVCFALAPVLRKAHILKSPAEGLTQFLSPTLGHLKAATREEQGRFHGGEGRPGGVTAHILQPPGEEKTLQCRQAYKVLELRESLVWKQSSPLSHEHLESPLEEEGKEKEQRSCTKCWAWYRVNVYRQDTIIKGDIQNTEELALPGALIRRNPSTHA